MRRPKITAHQIQRVAQRRRPDRRQPARHHPREMGAERRRAHRGVLPAGQHRDLRGRHRGGDRLRRARGPRILQVAAAVGLTLTSCAPSAPQLKKVMEENPDILYSVIQKDPKKFLDVVNGKSRHIKISGEDLYRVDIP